MSVYDTNPSLYDCVRQLEQGAVIAYPTEAVWGLGCDPFQAHAVEALLQLKGREAAKGLILITGQLERALPLLAGLSEAEKARVLSSWPGPHTWIVPHQGRIPDWISGGRSTVAIRVSRHPVVSALSRRFGGLLVSTSANPSGRAAARHAFQVHRYFGRQGLCIAPGITGGANRPSTITDARSGKQLR